jgi:hypothetical protein
VSLVSLLVALIVVCLLFWAIQRILAAFGIGDPIATLVQVVFVLIVVFWVLQSFGVIGSAPLRLR